MARQILEKYMAANAAAVLAVAESVEKLRMEEGRISSPEVAACLSVALYGAPPKPSARSVASLAGSHKGERLEVGDKSMADDVVLSMSVARYGLDCNRRRAEAAAAKISCIMEEIARTPVARTARKPYVNTLDRVFIGLNDDNTPRVDCSKYKLTGREKKITVASFQVAAVIESVEEQLTEVFSDVQDPQGGRANKFGTFLNTLVHNVNFVNVVAWADGIESALKEHERRPGTSSSSSTACSGEGGGALTSRHANDVTTAVNSIMKLVGKSFGKTVTQLTSAQDISEFQIAARTCYSALMEETHERIVCLLLFYVSFKVVDGSERDYVKKRLGAMAGTVREPLFIERREASETLFGLCFMLKVMPPDLVHCILSFPSAVFSYHGGEGTCVESLLRGFGPCFEGSWNRFMDVLSHRSLAVRALNDKRSRVDCVDATANLTGPVYVLILDVADAFQAQRACAYKCLNIIKEQCQLWSRFVKS